MISPVNSLAVTGHRPNKLGGYTQQAHDRLLKLAISELTEIKPSRVITGMALGWDQAIAEAAIELSLPFSAYVPCDGQQSCWPTESQKIYDNLLSNAAEIIIVSPGPYAAWKMHARNKAMVNACERLLALFSGSPGGTASCVTYAETVKRPIINCWDRYIELCQLK